VSLLLLLSCLVLACAPSAGERGAVPGGGEGFRGGAPAGTGEAHGDERTGEGRPLRVIAHRGASAYAPENTLPAFQRALALGAVEVEVDVQLSRDGVVVAFHDRTLERKTAGRGRVHDHDWQELRALDVGAWFDASHAGAETRYAGTRLASLAQIFATFGARLFYHVEIKSEEPELPASVLARVRDAGLEEHVMLTSSHLEQLRRARRLDDRVPLSLLVGDEEELRAEPAARAEAGLRELQRSWIERAARERFQQVALPSEEMTPEIVEDAHSRGLEIRAYRIRTREDMLHALAVGTDGMTINWPDWLLEALARRRNPEG
jgi:glycerophosphoryl diester phosphodiesterase